MMDRIISAICAACAVSVIVVVGVWACGTSMGANAPVGPVVLYHEDGKPAPVQGYEAPDESERIAWALVDAVGTDREQEAMGYDYSFVLSCVMAEGGGEYGADYFEELIWSLCGAIQNAVDGNRNPEDVCREWQYSTTAVPVSADVRRICDRVFIWGDTAPDIDGATVFWSDRYLDHAPDYHATLEEVEVIGPVHFCKEEKA